MTPKKNAPAQVTEYKMVWCEECEDAWHVQAFRCDSPEGDAPECPMCGSDGTAPFGKGEIIEDE